MEYLTTHDLVWINQIITGKVVPYNYITLEAVMAGQYRYGTSNDVNGQAANFLEQFLSKRPFTEGNLATALIAVLSFLNFNGYATKVSDAEAAEIMNASAKREISAADAISKLAAPATERLPENVTLRKLITHECHSHAEALRLIAQDA